MRHPYWTVYLAGPIAGQTYQGATDWRWEAACELQDASIECFSPMRAKAYLEKYAEMPHTHNHPLSTEKGITARDFFDVRRCDLILANFAGAERVSIGTAMELGFAHAVNKPIVAIVDQLHDHPMIRGVAGWIAEDLAQAVEIVKAILNP